MAKYRCTVCNYLYDEQTGVKFQDLPKDWKCPVCGASKSAFVLLTDIIEKHNGQTTVSDVLIHQLEEWGVKCFFGIPGSSTLGIHDAIRKRENLTYIQVRHEQVAAFMASAYGKLTGGVAACVGVSGPGATNLATGLYDASLDHAPAIAITGLVARQLTGPGSIQEIDQYSFFEPICVFNKILMSEDQTTTLGTLAVKHAILERGVSHIGVPNDVQKLPCDSEVMPFKGRVPNMAFCQSAKLVKSAAELIDASRRPVIVAGFGVMGQGVELLQFARKISAPIVTTYRAKGLVDGSEPLYVGCHGGIGTTAAVKLVQTSDLLIVVGSSYSDMTNIPEKRTVQIDIDPMMIAKKFPVEAGLVGNCSELVPMLRDLVSENVKDDYLREIQVLKDQWLKVLEGEHDQNSTPIRPQYIMEVIGEEVADDAVFSIDVGENAWWFGRNFWMKSTQKMVLSGYLASMGFGLPGAMAATVAYPGRQAVCITGDGGFAMVMGDFMTCVKYGMPVKVFVLNNGQLGMIMQEQKVEGYMNWQTELHNADFARFAESCGGKGIRVTEPAELRGAVRDAFNWNGPVIIDIITDPKRF